MAKKFENLEKQFLIKLKIERKSFSFHLVFDVLLYYVIGIFHFYLSKVFKPAFIIWRPYVGVPPFLLTWLVVRRWNFFCLINTGQSQLGQFEVCTFTVFCDDYVVGSNRSLKLSRPIRCVDYEMTILFLFLSVTFSDFI